MKFYVFQSYAFAKFYGVIAVHVVDYILTIAFVKDKCFIAGISVFKCVITGAAD